MTRRIIDADLLDEVSREARESPRRRRNRNFHPSDDAPSHRLLNAIEPGSYIMPHRHLDPNKDESIFVLRGALAAVFFDDSGNVTETALLRPGGAAVGVDVPHGTFHTLFALESGTVFFEAKGGPYLPLAEAERAPWAPAENAPEAADYLLRLEALFARDAADRLKSPQGMIST